MNNGTNHIFPALFAMLCLLILGRMNARAQEAEPRLVVTWTAARSSAPADFPGKILPGAKSLISASVMMIENGGAVDLSHETIYWYANNSPLDGGEGLTHVSFGATQAAPNVISLRVQLANYKGDFVVKTVEIPVVSPEAVIDAPFPRGAFGQSPAKMTGYPFFFTVPDVSSLRFLWNVNGAEPTGQENPWNLLLDVPSGTANGSSFTAGLTIENPFAFGQKAEAQANLIFKK